MQDPNSTGSDKSAELPEQERSPDRGKSGVHPELPDSGSAGVPPDFVSAVLQPDSGSAGFQDASDCSQASGIRTPHEPVAAETSEALKSILKQIGDFDSRYSPQELVGSGAMGVVLKATDVFLECDVAIKILSYTQANADEMRERFIREMRVLAALDHPNVVKIRSSGSTSKDYPFYVMDFLKGKSIAQMLSESQRLSSSVLKQVMPRILDGLQYLHENKIVHRDLKPSNIICVENADREIVPKLIDFGVAIAQDPSCVRLTKTNVSIGSPAYMSPEQCRGGQIDERSDIYSLGCILYECISGAPPFKGESALDVMYKQMNEPALSLDADSAGGARLISLCMQCLEKNPEKRPASVAELKLQFLNAIDDIDTVRLLKSSSASAKGNKFLWISLSVLLAVGVILLVFSVKTIRGLQESKRTTAVEQELPVTNKSHDKVVKAAMRATRALINEMTDKHRPVDVRATLVEKTMERLLFLQREIPEDHELVALFGKFNLALSNLLSELDNSNIDAVEKDGFKQEIVSARIPCLFFLGRKSKERHQALISELFELSRYSLQEFGVGSKQEIDALHTTARLMLTNGDFKNASKVLDLCFAKEQYDAVTIFSAQRRVINVGPALALPRGRSRQLIEELHVETLNALAIRKDLEGIVFCLKYIAGLQKFGRFDTANTLIPQVWAEIKKFPPSVGLDDLKNRLRDLESINKEGLRKMQQTGNNS